MHLILQGVSVNEFLSQIGQLIDEKMTSQHQTKNEKQSAYLSRKEVAQLLKITLKTLHEWTKGGILQSYKIGTRVLHKENEVKETLEKVPSFKHKKGGVAYGR